MDPKKQALITLIKDLKSGDPVRVGRAKTIREEYLKTGTLPNILPAKNAFPTLDEAKSDWKDMASDVTVSPDALPISKISLDEATTNAVSEYANKSKELAELDRTTSFINKNASGSPYLTAFHKLDIYKNNIEALTKGADLMKDAAKSLAEESVEQSDKKLRAAMTHLNNNSGLFANTKEYEAFMEMPALAVIKDLGIKNFEVIKKQHQEYLDLPIDKRKGSSFENTLRLMGTKYSSFMPYSPLYVEKANLSVTAALKNGTETPNYLKAEALIQSDAVIGQIYKLANQEKVNQFKQINAQAEKINNETNSAIEGLSNQSSKKIKEYESTLNDLISKGTSKEKFDKVKSEYLSYIKNIENLQNKLVTDANQKVGLLNQTQRELQESLEQDDDYLYKQSNLAVTDEDKEKRSYKNSVLGGVERISNNAVTRYIDQIYGLNSKDALSRFASASTNVGKRFVNTVAGTLYALDHTTDKELRFAAFKANMWHDELAWNTGKLDRNLNPVMSNTIQWTDSLGKMHMQWGAILEEGAQQAIMMTATGGATKALAKVVGTIAGIGAKGINIASKGKYLNNVKFTTSQILNAEVAGVNVGARALTFPAVYATTYGRTYYDNFGAFKTDKELKEYTHNMSMFEAITETIVPDVFFFDGLSSPRILRTLDRDNQKRLLGMLANVADGKSRKELVKRFATTLKTTTLKTFQEALIEEGLNYIMQGNWENKKIAERGSENYLRQGDELSLDNLVKTGAESLLTMGVSMLLGVPGDYRSASKKVGFDFTDPESMNYHRYNIAIHANTFRNLVSNHAEMTAEQKQKAFATIASYENTLKSSAMEIVKPDPNTLGNDEESLFLHFTAASDKEKLELKVAEGKASPEEIKTYENATSILEKINKSNKDWATLDPEQREKKWYKWFEESIQNTSSSGLDNSPLFQMHNLMAQRVKAERLLKSNAIDMDTYLKYQDSFKRTQKTVARNAKKNIRENLDNLAELSPLQVSILKQDISAFRALSNTAKIESYVEKTTVPRKEEEVNINGVYQERLKGKMQEDDVAEVEYRDTRGVPKTARLIKKGSTFVHEGTEEPFDRTNVIWNAKVESPVYGENENLISAQRFIEESFVKIQEHEKPKPGDPDIEEPTEEGKTPLPEETETEEIPAQSAADKWKALFSIPDLKERKLAQGKAILESTDPDADIAALQDMIDRDPQIDPAKRHLIKKIIETIERLKTKSPVEEEASTESKEEESIEEKPKTPETEEKENAEKETPQDTTATSADYALDGDARPTSGLISISDEYDENDKVISDPYTTPINLFLRRIGAKISEFKGSLMSTARFFEKLNVDVEAIRAILKEYWALDENARKSNKDDYRNRLVAEFKSAVPLRTITWLLEDTEKTETDREIYKLKTAADKFDTITMRSFLIVVSDKDGNIIKVNSDGKVSAKGSIPVSRALPKVNAQGYFYNITPLDPEEVRDEAKVLYEYQSQFLNNQDLEIPINLDKVSNGFEKSDYSEEAPTGDVSVQKTDSPLTGKLSGRAYDSDGDKVFTKELDPEHVKAVIAILTKENPSKEELAFVKQVLYLTSEELTRLSKLKPVQLVKELADKHYKIDTKSLNKKGSTITIMKVVGNEVEPGETMSYEDFIADKWYKIKYKTRTDYTGKPIEGNRKIYFTPAVDEEPVADSNNTKVDTAAPEDTEEMTEWEYSKEYGRVGVSNMQELNAYVWFMNSFLSSDMGFNYHFIEHPTAFASFTNAAITLYKGADLTMLYHEAWHRFTQEFLTKAQKDELYSALKSLISDKKLVGKERLKYEEALAEGFRNFMLSGGTAINIEVNGKQISIELDTPAAAPIKSFFQKLKAFLTSLFTKKDKNGKPSVRTAKELISDYMKEASRVRSTRTSDTKNSFFKQELYTSKNIKHKFTIKETGEEVFLDYNSLYELHQGVDALFVKFFNSKEIQDLPALKGKHISFTSLVNQSKQNRTILGAKIYNMIKAHIEQLAKTEKRKAKKLEYQAILDNFEESVIKESNELRNPFKNVYNESLEATLEELANDDSKLEISEVYETKLSQKELASENIINLVRLIPAVDKKGELKQSRNWRMPHLTDFTVNWLVLANNLSGLSYGEMLDRLADMSASEYPQMQFLIDNLPPKIIPVTDPISTFELAIQFEQTFTMPKVIEMITILATSPDGKLLAKFTEAGTSSTREVLQGWESNVEGFNLKKVLEDHKDLSTDAKALNFLKAIGIDYANRKTVLKSLKANKKRYNDFSDAIGRVYSFLNKLSAKGIKVDNPITALNSEFKKIGLIRSESKSLTIFANLEVETNDEVSDDMIIRADGERAWKFNQFNYLSKLTNDLDKLSYEEIAEKYPQFDVKRNPAIRNSIWFTELFTTAKDGSISRNSKTSLEFAKTGGMKSEELDDSQGTVTVDLTSSDKLLMDFYSFITAGIEENVKFGDKSTAGAMVLKGADKIAVQNRHLILDNLYTQLEGELATVRHLTEVGNLYKIPGNAKVVKQFKYTDPKKTQKLIFFNKMMLDEAGNIDEELKAELMDAELTLVNGKWSLQNSELKGRVIEAMDRYFNKVVLTDSNSFRSRLNNSLPSTFKYNKVIPEIYDPETDNKVEYKSEDVMLWYYMQSVSNRIDQFTMLYGDPRNYKNGSDVFKRLSAYSATGKFPSISDETLKRLNSLGRPLESMYSKSGRQWSSKFNIVQFKDVPVNLSMDYLGKDMSEDLRKAWGDYIKESDGKDKGDRSDASGAVTLDFYRAINTLIGIWDSKQEKAYQAQVKFVKAKMELETDESKRDAYNEARKAAMASYSDILTVFNPKKWQYAGSIFSTHTFARDLDVRSFLKFSVMPIIPSNIEGSELEKVLENMYKTNTDLYIFNSGSKMSYDQYPESFEDWSKAETPEFVPSVLDLNSFKEQLPIENKMKNEGIFSSQMRKLLSVGLYVNGKGVEGRDLTAYSNYKNAVKNITDIVKEELRENMSSTTKLIAYIEGEFQKRDMPDHVKDFLNYYKESDRLVDTLDLSLQSFFIQNILFSIVNSKLINQRYPGGQFVQLPNIGYRNATFKENAEYRRGDLKFYKDGRPMEIKIAFSKKYESLLNIEYKGERVGNLDNLNRLLEDEDFVKEHGKKFTMVGCRIPVQGFSTIESMIVKKFLDPIAGQVVIVPEGLTIKSGSDFDIDKLNIYEPTLDANGNLVEALENPIEEYREAAEMEDDIRKEISDLRDSKRAISEIAKEEIAQIEAEEEDNIELPTTFKGSLEDMKTAFTKNNVDTEQLKKDKKKDRNQKLKEIDEMIETQKALLRELKSHKKSLLPGQINSLISSISDIVLDKDNQLNLMTKNELAYIVDAYQGVGIPANKDDSTLDISQIIDVVSSNEVAENNNSAKKTLGIAAKSNTLFAMFLESGMKVISPSPTTMSQNRNSDGSVSLSDLYTQEYKGGNSKYKSSTGKLYIPQVLSEFISATVDVANDNRVGDPRFNFNKITAPIYIYGIMRGTHLFELVDLIGSPTIRNLVKEYAKRDSIVYQHYINANIKDVKAKNKALSKKLVLSNAIKDTVPSEYHEKIPMLDSDGFQILDKKGRPIFKFSHIDTAINFLKSNPVGPAEAVKVANFVMLMEDANEVTKLSSAVSWDTNTSKSFVEFEYPKKVIQDVLEEGFFEPNAVKKLVEDSVISALDINDFVKEKFSPLFSIISSPEFIGRVLELYKLTNRVSLESFVRDYTNDFMTFVFQNNAKFEEEDGSFSPAYQVLLQEARYLRTDNPNNIEVQLKNVMDRAKGTGIEDNAFLKAIKFKKVKFSKTLSPVLKNANVDVHTLNLYHNDILALLESDYSNSPELNEEIQALTNDLLLSTLLLNGINKTYGSFVEIIPTELYTETLRDAVSEGITQDMYKAFEEMFLINRHAKHFKDLQTPNVKIDKNNRFNYFISEENDVSLQHESAIDAFADLMEDSEYDIIQAVLDRVDDVPKMYQDMLMTDPIQFLSEVANQSQDADAKRMAVQIYGQALVDMAIANFPQEETNLDEGKLIQSDQDELDSMTGVSNELQSKENVTEVQPDSIYSKLGDKTASGNVQIKSVYQKPGVDHAKSIGGIFSMRLNYTDKHFGNPFSHVPAEIAKGLIATNSIKESVEEYIRWILGTNLDTDGLYNRLTKIGDITTLTFNEEQNDIKVKILGIENLSESKTKVKVLNLKTNKEYTYIVGSNGMSDEVDIDFKYGNDKQLEERRQWIREQLQSGILKNKPIVYYKELGEPSHATALDYLINKYNWSTEKAVSVPAQPINKESKSDEMSPGAYVRYNGVPYIITKTNANGTIQIYNPAATGKDAKKSVSSDNLTSMNDSAKVVKYKDVDYLVTAKGTIISTVTNTAMKWGAENGDRKAILDMANEKPVDDAISNLTGLGIFTNHSGGALGADSQWDIIGKEYGMTNNKHYYMGTKTPRGNTRISQQDELEGQAKATVAARQMGRIEQTHQIRDERIIRNWLQVKNSDSIIAISSILEVGDSMNHGKKAAIEQVSGGTGFAVQMAINENKPVYIFDQNLETWFTWNGTTFQESDTPTLTKNFAGIGTREINESGKQAIRDVYERTTDIQTNKEDQDKIPPCLN